MIFEPKLKEVEIDGQRVVYEQSGSGHPLVLMHGWGCNRTTVRTIAQVAATSNTVYNIDFPGFGDSPEPSAVWSVYDYADLVEKFIKRLGLDAPVLVGHSFGGRIAIIIASRNKVQKVVLIDAAGLKPHRTFSYYYKVYSFKAAKAAIKMISGSPAKAQKRIEALRAKRGSADYQSASPHMKAIMSKVVNEYLTDLLPLITAPTLLIWGEEDTATPLSDAKKMNSLIPDSGLVSFPGCGHYSFLDNRLQFTAVLKSFFNS